MVTTPRTRSFRILVCVALILSLLTFNAAVSPGLTSVTVATAAPLSFDTATRARLNATYGRLPLYFEANQGQSDPQVRFLARGGGHTLFLTPTEAVLVLTKQDPSLQAVLRMTFMGASPQAQIMGQREVAGKVNYFLGNDPAKWRTNVPTYAAVRYEGLYPGIDLVYYGNNQQLEYDLVVAPGADPSQIALSFKGADRLEVDAQGDLVLHTAVGAIHQRRPLIYQELEDGRREISGGYVLKGAESVGFQVAAHDISRPLVIDPGVVYSTYLSYADHVRSIAVDATGAPFVTGFTFSGDFPTTVGAFQTAHGGGHYDVFVTKLNASGSGLVYSTYLGGANDDFGSGIAVDATGNAYVGGYTTSNNFPTAPGSVLDAPAFVAKLNSTGSGLVYTIFLAGVGSFDQPDISIAVDKDGNAYMTGFTWGNLSTTAGAFQTTSGGYCDAFATKINSTGSGLVYSTYLGGSRGGDGAGYCTERGLDISVDAAGNAYVIGYTNSIDFPTTPGAFQEVAGTDQPYSHWANGFVTKLNPSGSEPVYSTYLPVGTYPLSMAVDLVGNAYLTGEAGPGFPTTPGVIQTVHRGSGDAFVMELNAPGSGLVYSTFIGGSNRDLGTSIAVDAHGNAYVTGRTTSTDFPTTAGAFQTAYGGA